MADAVGTTTDPSLVRADDFEILGIRVVAFTPNRAAFKPSAVLAAMLGRFAAQYSGDVQSLPIPPQAPPEIPRVILKGEDGKREFLASPASVTSLWRAQAGDSSIADSLADIVTQVVEPVEYLVTKDIIRPGRLAIVFTRGCENLEPSKLLTRRFCRPDVTNPESAVAPLRNSESFEIHNLKRYSSPVADVVINSWVRCKTGKIDGNSAIVVEQDINTLAEESDQRVFRSQDVTKFYEMATEEADRILVKYFP